MRASQPATQDQMYKTADLYYAAYLKVAGLVYRNEEVEGRRVYFVFEHSPNIEDLKRDYYNRKGKVPALTYSEEVKALKSLTFEAQRRRE